MNPQDLIDRAEIHKLNGEFSEAVDLWRQVDEAYPGTEQSSYANDQLNKHNSHTTIKKDKKDSVGVIPNLMVIFGMFIAGYMMFGNTGIESSNNSSSNKNSHKTEKAPVITFTKSYKLEGMTEEGFDLEWLSQYEAWSKKTILQKGKDSYANSGYDPKNFNPKITTKSVFLTVDGKKLAIVKVNAGNSSRSVTILGNNGEEQSDVTCVRNSNHDIPVWSGKCGDKIQKTFGVSVNP